MGHRRLLSRSHPYRSMDRQFDGTRESQTPPPYLSGSDVYSQLKDIPPDLGKKKQEFMKMTKRSRIRNPYYGS